ncbi:hypothetical protein HDU76_002709, partial [Blyttiomyces sp. JEL0837]
MSKNAGQTTAATIELEIGSASDLEGLKDGEMKEILLPDSIGGKVLISKVSGTLHATSNICPHYSAPLIKGVLSHDGRVMCPWHGACFNVQTGDIEDGPSLDALQKYPLKVKDGVVVVSIDPEGVRANRRTPSCVKHKPSRNTKTVVIIGGGSAGAIAAESLRQAGFTGSITLLTKEPHLPIDRPKLSKSLNLTTEKVLLRNEFFYTLSNLTIKPGTSVTSVDTVSKRVSTDDGSTYKYDYLILAMGSSARTLPSASNLSNIYTLRTIKDSNDIYNAVQSNDDVKKNVVVIGGSFIGMEVGAVLKGTLKNVASVVVLGRDGVPFQRILGREVGEVMKRLSEKNGVEVRMGVDVEGFESSPDDATRVGFVVLKGGERVPADVIVVGAGSIPNTSFLKDSGITLDRDGGITVGADMMVPGADGVFAVGDIARYPYNETNNL